MSRPHENDPAGPESRRRLHPEARAYASLLASRAETDPQGRAAEEVLASRIVARLDAGAAVRGIVVCTGNSRRSMLGSCMANLAAAYHGLPEIRFHSGGTSPTAFNPRTIATLRSIGFVIEPEGTEAPRGELDLPNPGYRVSWGDGLSMSEFSKHFADPSNPSEGFVAVMVCSEADEGCPLVPGAFARISMPFEDPKAFDDTPEEAAKYAERRDEIGLAMFRVMRLASERRARG